MPTALIMIICIAELLGAMVIEKAVAAPGTMQKREVVSKTLTLLEDDTPEEHLGYVDWQRGEWSQQMQSSVEVPFIPMLLVRGEGIADGEVCVSGLTSSVHGTDRVHDRVGR